MSSWIIAGTALGYLFLLSLLAWSAESVRKKGKSWINNGYVYALSMAVYCTAWTYYGSVGRAATSGLDFLTIYIGPTILCALFWPVLLKIIRICRTQGITSIADLVSTRYGKNFSLAVLVTIFCVMGVIPYIALQLKAIATSFDLLAGTTGNTNQSIWKDSTFYGTLLLTIFILFFGTRSVDAAEKHEGLIAAIAFESVIKLVAFLAAGLFITYGVFNGFSDLFQQANSQPRLQQLFTFQENNAYTSWFSMLTLSFFAMLFLPRQFQVNVVENLDENHLKTSGWVFPLYLFVINLFVVPIALAGSVLYAGATANPDLYVLNIPLDQGRHLLSLLIFIGGFSAATGMIIVETIALTTMISNHLALPLLFSTNRLHQESRRNLSAVVLWVRRGSILLVIGLSLLYDKLVAEQYSLVSIGLVSFAAVAQLAPAVLGGLYWKGASKNGALAGLAAGFICWMFTLLLPSLAGAGLLDNSILENGYFAISWLKPYALFGLTSLDPVSHSLFWSLLLNSGFFVLVSINGQKGTRETFQAELFVDFLTKEKFEVEPAAWKNTANLPALRLLLQNFIGSERAVSLFQKYANRHQIPLNTTTADPRLVQFTEKILAGVIGSASAHILVSRVAKAEELSMGEVLNLLRESQQMMELNKELRRKSAELTRATEQLSALNRQLMAMDEKKDEFLYTVTHELRTPLTSIRALTELVHDNPEMPENQKTEFLAAVVRETERLSHLITQVLSLERFESGKQPLELQTIQIKELLDEALSDIQPLVQQKKLRIETQLTHPFQLVELDPILIRQVLYNLLTNAIRFSPESGTILFAAEVSGNHLEISVSDQGKGIPEAALELIFDKFYQAPNQTLKKPEGSGLGLAISKKIIELHTGNIRAQNREDGGARFIFILPLSQTNL